MKLIRSQNMNLYRLLIPRQNAWKFINIIGKLDLLNIMEQNDIIQNQFINQIHRCDQALLKIKHLQDQIILNGQNINKIDLSSNQKVYQLFQKWDNHMKLQKKNGFLIFSQNQENLQYNWNYFMKIKNNSQNIKQRLINNQQILAVYQAIYKTLGQQFFNSYESLSNFKKQNLDQNIIENFGKFQGINIIVSICQKQEQIKINRLLFRSLRGNILTYSVDIDDKKYIQLKNKVVFFIFNQGNQGSIINKKINRIIQSFGMNKIIISSFHKQLLKTMKQSKQQLLQVKGLLKLTHKQITSFIETLIEHDNQFKISKIFEWKLYFLKQKEIYKCLNSLKQGKQFFISNVWLPTFNQAKILSKLIDHQDQNHFCYIEKLYSTNRTPPTYFQTNQFLYPGQTIVETYGTPRYQQISPSLFTCITFPFLFGIMFGDIGHGLILLIFGIYLIKYQKLIKEKNYLIKGLLSFKYMIALMGLFAFYMGWIYNDFLALPLNVFGSCFNMPDFNITHQQTLNPRSEECVYPFGLDPAWNRSTNYLTFINSLKMKASVLIGVIQMTFGIFLKGGNNIYFRKFIDFFFQFLPQIFFMLCLFGYMNYLIVLKWLTSWKNYEAPSIITTLINMVLQVGKVGQKNQSIFLDNSLQQTIQIILLCNFDQQFQYWHLYH